MGAAHDMDTIPATCKPSHAGVMRVTVTIIPEFGLRTPGRPVAGG